MGVQAATDYSRDHNRAIEGAIVDAELTNTVSKTAEGSDIPFGRWVARGAADDGAKLPAVVGDEFVGIVTRRLDQANQPDDTLEAKQNRSASVVDFGKVWVITEEAVSPGDPVEIRYTGAGSGPGGFRTSNVVGQTKPLAGATFETTAAANGLAVIRLR